MTTTGEAITKIITPSILEERYTGEEIDVDKVKAPWQDLPAEDLPRRDLPYPDIKITTPSGQYLSIEMKPLEERVILILPERLTDPRYGSAELEKNLKEMAKKAPGIEEIWKITEKLPSLTKLILEERENE